jgi:hypothetical protein
MRQPWQGLIKGPRRQASGIGPRRAAQHWPRQAQSHRGEERGYEEGQAWPGDDSFCAVAGGEETGPEHGPNNPGHADQAA